MHTKSLHTFLVDNAVFKLLPSSVEEHIDTSHPLPIIIFTNNTFFLTSAQFYLFTNIKWFSQREGIFFLLLFDIYVLQDAITHLPCYCQMVSPLYMKLLLRKCSFSSQNHFTSTSLIILDKKTALFKFCLIQSDPTFLLLHEHPSKGCVVFPHLFKTERPLQTQCH